MTSKRPLFLILFCIFTLCYFDLQTEMGTGKARAHSNLALMYYKVGRYAEAKEQYLISIQKDPKAPHAYINLGAVLVVEKNYDEAIKVFNKVLELDPGDRAAYFNLGRIYYKTGRLEEAAHEFWKVAKCGHADLESVAWNDIGVIRAQQGRHRDALAAFENAIKVDKTNAEAIKNYREFIRFHKEV